MHASILRLTAVLLLSTQACAAESGAILIEARIQTMNPAQPYAEAMAIGADGRVLALGTSAAIKSAHPHAHVIDAHRHTVVPGLIDAHGHVLGLGLALSQAQLVGTTSKVDVIARLQAFEKTLPKDAWLLGRGWDQNDWPEKAFPSAADLDQAFPARPVWLERVDGHASWANSAAMKLAVRDLGGDWQPDGGKIVRANGKPTGIFVDVATNLIGDAVPRDTPEVIARALDNAFKHLVRHGLTGVHDAGVPLAELDLYRQLADAGRIPLRIYAMADGTGAALDALCRDGAYLHPGGRLQMRTVKLYIDGALGSRGAALLDDYSDDAGNRGLLVTSEKDFDLAVRKAQGCKLQIATHAIGDRGNRIVLDTYERALGAHTGEDHRWRIEHAQIVALSDIARFAKLGVIASMQPTHATSDMPWAEQRLGAARIVGGYSWRQFRDSGARLALGSDFPVEDVNPMFGLYAAATRQDELGAPAAGWYPSQRLTPYEALRGFTLDAAYAGFAEHELGSLEPGKRADFAILSNDPVSDASNAVRATTVLATYVDGKAVYQAKD